MQHNRYVIEPIGIIRSELTDLEDAPRQGMQGGPEAWLEISPRFASGLDGVKAGDNIVVLTWLHLAQRNVLEVHPRGSKDASLRGVFATRSQNRPNPIGLHHVTVLQTDGQALQVAPMEAIHGTPIVDIKPEYSYISQEHPQDDQAE